MAIKGRRRRNFITFGIFLMSPHCASYINHPPNRPTTCEPWREGNPGLMGWIKLNIAFRRLWRSSTVKWIQWHSQLKHSVTLTHWVHWLHKGVEVRGARGQEGDNNNFKPHLLNRVKHIIKHPTTHEEQANKITICHSPSSSLPSPVTNTAPPTCDSEITLWGHNNHNPSFWGSSSNSSCSYCYSDTLPLHYYPPVHQEYS